MILDDFLAFNQHGLYCKYGNFYLDPKEPAEHAVISHAHGDHAVPGNRNIYCTAPTADFMRLRYGKNAGTNFKLFGWHQEFTLGDVSISFISAGHILGSAQVLMTYRGVSYLYTGDYKLQPDSTCEPIEWVKADVLITESTFANPNTTHPNPVTEIEKLNGIQSNILLGAYGLGKAQRLIRMINDHAPLKKILVHFRIAPLNAIYEKHGITLGNWQMYNRKLMKNQDGYVYLVPPFTFDSYFRATGVKRLFASGWKNLQVNQQDTLFISDHADWNDVLKAIEEVNPQQLWTLHGEGSHLKEHLHGRIFTKALN
ncbi:MBL fold metallo-hydrolase [Mucilaginibacter galii]|uniref:DNA ligase-associated DEXH box helicase n=1 Tax=Mucilaginibacter galii TaxID=2005073 RepID=A0A917N2R1_9SPHI|nr:MBL fold metallo-hydrolase [Mucilaginibacter galii]GGI50332.1 DNA ligase-associated DEXH box helicase [Mucilaginibacter galii]